MVFCQPLLSRTTSSSWQGRGVRQRVMDLRCGSMRDKARVGSAVHARGPGRCCVAGGGAIESARENIAACPPLRDSMCVSFTESLLGVCQRALPAIALQYGERAA